MQVYGMHKCLKQFLSKVKFVVNFMLMKAAVKVNRDLIALLSSTPSTINTPLLYGYSVTLE